jgi:hypothetical protein
MADMFVLLFKNVNIIDLLGCSKHFVCAALNAHSNHARSQRCWKSLFSRKLHHIIPSTTKDLLTKKMVRSNGEIISTFEWVFNRSIQAGKIFINDSFHFSYIYMGPWPNWRPATPIYNFWIL